MRQSIYNALKYWTQSDLAKSIRIRAKELLEEEIKEIELTEKENV